MRKPEKRSNGRLLKRLKSSGSRLNAKRRKRRGGRSWNGANVRNRPAGRRKTSLWKKMSLNRKGVFPSL